MKMDRATEELIGLVGVALGLLAAVALVAWLIVSLIPNEPTVPGWQRVGAINPYTAIYRNQRTGTCLATINGGGVAVIPAADCNVPAEK